MTEKQVYRIFSENLKRLRKAHHLSQQQVADVLSVNIKRMIVWEDPQREATPSAFQLLGLSELFFVNITDLLTTENLKQGWKNT